MIDFTSKTTEELQTLKWENQQLAQAARCTFGQKAQARGNVRKINVILRQRGALKDAKALLAAKDDSGRIAQAVAPLKVPAVEEAVARASHHIETLVTQYQTTDLNVVAPFPNSLRMSKRQYIEAKAKRSHLQAILKPVQHGYGAHDPIILERDPEREQRYLDGVRAAVSAEFDAYVAKLEGKVGQGVLEATVSGNYLWQGSTLTVRKAEGVEQWHTQQIVNVSVLGKLFNQWPTRLLASKRPH